MSRHAAGTALDALGNPVRRQIITLLAQKPAPVGAIAAQLPVSRPAVSKHLALLEAARLVAFETSGRQNVYRLDTGGFEAASTWLDSFWSDALSRFMIVAENTGPGDA